MNLGEMLSEAARLYGDKTAIVQGKRRFSYRQLDEDSNRLANALREIGVGRGDRVAILLDNCYQFVIIYFGIVRLGASAVPLDTKYKALEISAVFDDCRPKVLFTEGGCSALAAALAAGLGYIKKVVDISSQPLPGLLSYQHLIDSGSPEPVADARSEDIAHIAYTSGPTLRPRGAMLIQERLVAGIALSAAGFKQTGDDVVMLFALPMHHAVGMVVAMLTSLSQGSTVVILPGFSMSALLESVERERVTIFMGVPFVYALLLREIEEKNLRPDLSSLRICASAGAPLEVSLIRRFKDVLGKKLIQFDGLTEATVQVTCQPIDGSGKDGAVGKVLPLFKIKIMNDAGRTLRLGEAGEIMVKGPIMKGYYNSEVATATAIEDGWLHTGDIGRFDEDGQLYIMALKKPMLISKGQNIYFSDLEDVLAGHPAVAAVKADGIPDPEGMRGEVVRAVIRLKEGRAATEAEIRKYCLDRIANYKAPKQVIFSDSIPGWQDTTSAAGRVSVS